jgi:translation initiation factor 4E
MTARRPPPSSSYVCRKRVYKKPINTMSSAASLTSSLSSTLGLKVEESSETKKKTSRAELDPNAKQGNALSGSFSFWYLKKTPNMDYGAYETALKKVGVFNTVEGFTSHFSHMVKPQQAPCPMEFHLFREGILPMWEDEKNAEGGEWVVRFKKGIANRIWEESVLAVVGDAFDVQDQLCGVVLSQKHGENIVSFWTKDASNKAAVQQIKDVIMHVLKIPAHNLLEYKNHHVALNKVRRQNSYEAADTQKASISASTGNPRLDAEMAAANKAAAR